MKTTSLPFVAVAAALTVAGAAQAQPARSPSNPPPPPARPVTAAMPFLALAGEADVYEITSSQLAVMRSRNPQIRQFATMLIQHHTETSNNALAAARAAGIMAGPPVLGPVMRGQLDRLYAAGPGDFDGEYVRQQIPAHEQALALHTTYARSGDTPQLRQAAQGAIPIVEAHLAQARGLARR